MRLRPRDPETDGRDGVSTCTIACPSGWCPTPQNSSAAAAARALLPVLLISSPPAHSLLQAWRRLPSLNGPSCLHQHGGPMRSTREAPWRSCSVGISTRHVISPGTTAGQMFTINPWRGCRDHAAAAAASGPVAASQA
jgi:hypothetical protein